MHRNLRVALETESKKNTSFGKDIYSKILETHNPYLYDTLTDVICGLFQSDQKFTITKIKSLINDAEISLNKIGIQSLAKIDMLSKITPKAFIIWIENDLMTLLILKH